ncbi:MAG: CoA-binding protein [Clostridiaceae bacterium]|nr:CoA-binding protein [Clostridiaceae bacterium]
MKNLSKEFFTEKEVIFMGYSSRTPQFSNMIYKAFTDAGIKVYPINPRKDGKFDVNVYSNISELPKTPKIAYILLNNENARKAVEQLMGTGVEKILFHRGKTADQQLLNDCAAAGIETAVACPLMLFGSGLHKLHAFFAGVK